MGGRREVKDLPMPTSWQFVPASKLPGALMRNRSVHMKSLLPMLAFVFCLLALQVPVASLAQDVSNEASGGEDSQALIAPTIQNRPLAIAIVRNDGGDRVTIAGPKLAVVPPLQHLYSCAVVDNGYWGILFKVCHHEPSGKVIYEWSGNDEEAWLDTDYSVIRRTQAGAQTP